LTIDVRACDGSWFTSVTFHGDTETASRNAIAFLERKDAQHRRHDGLGQIVWDLATGEPSDDLAAFLWPSCEHGMSAQLCAGPGHYPSDDQIGHGASSPAELHSAWHLENGQWGCPWDCAASDVEAIYG
jgi:hypothetical protein